MKKLFSIVFVACCFMLKAETDSVPTILPIELTSFTSVTSGSTNIVTWVVASQLDNKMFTLKSSMDCVSWNTVVTVSGAGTSAISVTYQFIDPNPTYLTYYKLSQTDYDGKTKEFYPIAAVNPRSSSEIKLLKIVNEMGQNVSDSTPGLKFYYFSNGLVVKMVRNF